jgi:outer membrane protein OmpA-like peptidoglycan-associated protein
MRPTIFVALAAITLTVSTAAAQNGGDIELQAFQPSMDSRGVVTLNGSSVLAPGELSLGLVTNWGRGLVSLESGDQSYEVANMVSPTLVFAAGVFRRGNHLAVELGASLPFHIMQGDRGPDSDNGTPDMPNDDSRFGFTGQGLGSTALHLKIRPLRTKSIGVALLGSVYLPTASEEESWLGGTGVRPQIGVVVDRRMGRFTVTANAGFRYQPGGVLSFTDNDMTPGTPATMEEISVGSILPLGLGASYAVSPQKFDLVAEVFGAVPLEGDNYLPVEAIVGAKAYLATNSYLTLGGGTGLARGMAGSPDLRAFIGIVFEPRASDRDGDGISDADDACPDDPEDYDGFEDLDGCPELDNDRDGIADEDDACPNDPEDLDGFEDEDGCPETQSSDRDGDGLLDDDDQCPDDPEDMDGFEDSDGCPDPDNDGDGILDVDDLCPDTPEDFDNFEDTDGCPEDDNDKDLIKDADDECPRVDGQSREETAEVYNGKDDEDGCPDRGGPVVEKDGVIEVLKEIHFEYDSDVIKKQSHNILDAVAGVILSNPAITRVEVQGHTDERGSDAYNLDLSQRRANSVVRYLVGKKVKRSRLEPRGYGETKPKDTRSNPRAWAKNRRVEFVIVGRSD